MNASKFTCEAEFASKNKKAEAARKENELLGVTFFGPALL
jgi:hypothetical protein